MLSEPIVRIEGRGPGPGFNWISPERIIRRQIRGLDCMFIFDEPGGLKNWRTGILFRNEYCVTAVWQPMTTELSELNECWLGGSVQSKTKPSIKSWGQKAIMTRFSCPAALSLQFKAASGWYTSRAAWWPPYPSNLTLQLAVHKTGTPDTIKVNISCARFWGFLRRFV